MLSEFGKICRKTRIDKGILLYDMAKDLGVSPAFLSKVENGKAKPRKEWADKISAKYADKNQQKVLKEELEHAIEKVRSQKTVEVLSENEENLNLVLQLARKLENADKTERNRISKLLSEIDIGGGFDE